MIIATHTTPHEKLKAAATEANSHPLNGGKSIISDAALAAISDGAISQIDIQIAEAAVEKLAVRKGRVTAVTMLPFSTRIAWQKAKALLSALREVRRGQSDALNRAEDLKDQNRTVAAGLGNHSALR